MTEKKKSNLVGEFKIVIGQAGPYLTVITALMMAATFYHTTLVDWMSSLGWTIPLWLFFLIIVTGGIAFLLYERRYRVNDYFSAWSEYWWNSNNPMKDSMEKQQGDIDRIKKKLEIDSKE